MLYRLLQLFALGAIAAPDAATPIRVELDAPRGCSSAEAFYEGVRARTERVRRARAGEHALSLRVRLTRNGQGVHGELSGFDGNGKTETRVVDGAGCDDVVEALSLTAALAIDPEARFQPLPSTSPNSGNSADSVTSSRAEPAPKIKAEPPPLDPSASDGDLEGEARHDDAVGPSGPSAPFRFWLGVEAVASRVETSRPSFGGALFARLAQTGSAILSPSFGISVIHVRNDLFEGAERLSLSSTSIALSGCPVRFGSKGDIAVRPCAIGLGGWLSAQGENLSNPSSVVRSWWSVGGVLHGSAGLGATFALEVEAGFTVPLVRRNFVTTIPDERVGRTPSIAPLAGLGVAYGF